MKLKCNATCWMPNSVKKGAPLEKFEDDPTGDGSDVYEVDEQLVEQFLATGNFETME